MKINRDTFLIKLHYFLFFGGMAPIMPFGLVMSMQLGGSVALMGNMGALILINTVLLKPIVSIVADAFPRARRPLFVGLLLLFCCSLSFIVFIPPFKQAPSFSSAWITSKNATETNLNNIVYQLKSGEFGLNDSMSCKSKFQQENSSDTSHPWSDLQIVLPHNDSCELQSGRDCQFAGSSSLLQLKLFNSSHGYSTYTVFAPHEHRVHCSDLSSSGSLDCVGGDWDETHCGGSVLQTGAFWSFVLLLAGTDFAYSTTNSFTDAITVDTLGDEGDYGSQRLWGVVSWGLMGISSSALIDWYSGAAETKDYTPGFILVFIFMGLDVIVSSFLKIPKLEPEGAIWNTVKPLMKKVDFVLFLFFTLMNGIFNAVPLIYLFVLMEERAAGTPLMKHMKLMQGLTVLLRSACELPWMHYADRLIKKFGASNIQTAVFGVHAVRLGLLAVVGQWGSVWGILVVEVLDGPVYGLGYPLVVLYAKQFTPPGLTNTVQSLANNAYDMLSYAVSSALSGLLVSQLGTTNTFWIWAACGAVTCALHVIFAATCTPRDTSDPLKRDSSSVRSNTSNGADGLQMQISRARQLDA
ncbi:Major facilitator superfamily associated domain [Trinorchestia longiramus]|nr:Major facilitator superfamily associated domain [Trinorchestia longiramus]